MTGRSRSIPIVAFAALLLAGGTLGCAPASGASLEGREFLSVAVTDGGADRPLVQGTQIRLSFSNGSLGANAGCNHIGGTYRIEAGRLVLSAAAMTEMGCDPPRHDQDDWLVELLSSRPAIALTGDELVITAGATVVRLRDRRVVDPDRPLAGPTWVVTGLIGPGGDGGAVSSVPDGVVASLGFHEDGSVDVQTGCNQGSGRWTSDAAGLHVTELGLTKRACDAGPGQVEGVMVAVLGAAALEVTITAGQLILRAPGGQGLMLEAR